MQIVKQPELLFLLFFEYETPVPGIETVVRVPPPAFFVTRNPFVPQLKLAPDLLKVVLKPPPKFTLFLKRKPTPTPPSLDYTTLL